MTATPASARVCRLHAAHDIRLETVSVEAPGEGEVLVRMGVGGICGSDMHYFQHGGFGPIRVKEPIILGHEAAGTVAAVGPGVSGLREGQKVSINPSRPCDDCRFCAAGQPNQCLAMRFSGSAMRMPHEQGLFREAIVVPAGQCVPLDDARSLGEGAIAEPLAVCLHAAHRAGPLDGARVLVTGAGPIGALCAAIARHRGATDIVVTDLEDFPLEIAARMGATRTINVKRDAAALDAYAADKGTFDIAFECSAAVPAIEMAIACVRPLGRIVQVGIGGTLPIPLNALVAKELELVGTHRFHAEFADAVALINDGAIDVTPIITQALPLDRMEDAFQMAGDRQRAVKVQLRLTEPD